MTGVGPAGLSLSQVTIKITGEVADSGLQLSPPGQIFTITRDLSNPAGPTPLLNASSVDVGSLSKSSIREDFGSLPIS